MRIAAGLVVAGVALCAVLSCAGTRKAVRPVQVNDGQSTRSARVLEHRDSAAGGALPDWLLDASADLEALPEQQGLFAFRFDRTGEGLEELRSWSRAFDAPREVGRVVTARLAAGVAAAGLDVEALAAYLRTARAVVEVAEYAGTRRAAEWWVQLQYLDAKGKPAERRYVYCLLYTVPREQVRAAARRALGEADRRSAPRGEEERAMRERLRALCEESL